MAFGVFDADKSGKVSAAEFRALMKNYGAALSAQETEEIIRYVDEDGDGEVRFAVSCLSHPRRFCFLNSLIFLAFICINVHRLVSRLCTSPRLTSKSS